MAVVRGGGRSRERTGDRIGERSGVSGGGRSHERAGEESREQGGEESGTPGARWAAGAGGERSGARSAAPDAGTTAITRAGGWAPADRAGGSGSPLVRVCDLAGRPRGTGFLADRHGTLVTSHEAVDGLARLVLYAAGEQVCLVEAGAVTPLPGCGLALVATEGVDVRPLPIAARGPGRPGRRAVLRLPRPATATLLGTVPATYTATDRFHLIEETYELALDGIDLADAGPQVSGTPVLDAATGAVLAVLVTALHAEHRAEALAVPLHTDSAPAPLAELIARSGAAVPAYGPHLNLAGALRLTGADLDDSPAAGPGGAPGGGSGRGPGGGAAGRSAGAASGRLAAMSRLTATAPHSAGPAAGVLTGASRCGAPAGVSADAGPGSGGRRAGGGTGGSAGGEPVARPGIGAALGDFLGRRGDAAPLVLGLVGEPGTGRSTVLADLARRRRSRPHAAPTVLLRGAELRPGDGSLRDAVERALRAAVRTATSTGVAPDGAPSPQFGYGGEDPARSVAAVGASCDRPLAVLLDAPEEMPPVLAHELAGWTAATATWLRVARVRWVVACRPEFWEQAGALLPADLVYAPGTPDAVTGAGGAEDGAATGGGPCPSGPRRPLPPCVRVGDLTEAEANEARGRHGLPAGALRPADARHPLAMRLMSEVRGALGEGAEQGAPPSRAEIFAAHLDAVCLRIALRLGGLAPSAAPAHGRAVRRLATRVAGRAHEAARLCLGPGQGELDREAFEALFPWRTGWAAAVLAEGLLVPAGAGYRFAHEEFGDWLQSLHLDLPAALHALVHRWLPAPGSLAPPAVPGDAPVRLPSRMPARSAWAPAARAVGTGGRSRRGGRTGGRATPRAARDDQPAGAAPAPWRPVAPPVPPAPPVGPAGRPRSLPVPHHRAGPVVGGLLLAPPDALAAHLGALVDVLDDGCAGRPVPPGTPVRAPAAPPPVAVDSEADTVPIRRGRSTAAGAAGGGARPVAVPSSAAVLAPPAAGSAEPPTVARRRTDDAHWWAAHLLREALLRVEDAGPCLPVLRALAGRIVVRSIAVGGFVPELLGGLGEFGPWFWRALPLAEPDRLELLRVLLPADAPPRAGRRDRFLAVVAEAVRAGGEQAVAAVCGWLGDDRPLQAAHPFAVGGRLTVASAAQALLHTHARQAPVAVTEVLVEAGHPGADAVLAALAEDQPGAVCHAVDRWAHDPRPERRAAAAAHAVRVAPFARRAAEREPLRYAALALLARADERGLHAAALGILVRDPQTRVRYLPAALQCFAAGDPAMAPATLAAAIGTHPEMVLDAFRARLRAVGQAACRAVAGTAATAPPGRAAASPGATAGPAHAVDGAHTATGQTAVTPRRADETPAADAGNGSTVVAAGDGAVCIESAGALGAAGGSVTAGMAGAAGAAVPVGVAGPAGAVCIDAAGAAASAGRSVTASTAGAAGAVGTTGAADPAGAAGAGEVLAALASVRDPVLARRAAVLVEDHVREYPAAAPDVARYLDLRLEHGPGARPVLLTLTAALLRDHPASVRAALLPVFALPGSHQSQPLRHELLDSALATERDPDVLAALLAAAARAVPDQHPLLTRDLVHRLALLLTRTPEGAARFDRSVVALAAAHPPFAHLLRTWLTDATWDALLGPSARHDLLAAS